LKDKHGKTLKEKHKLAFDFEREAKKTPLKEKRDEYNNDEQ